jgi:hypothetical protein
MLVDTTWIKYVCGNQQDHPHSVTDLADQRHTKSLSHPASGMCARPIMAG